MRPRSVVVVDIRVADATQRDFMKHNYMIKAFATNGTDHPLHIGSLPRGSGRGQHFLNAHVSHLSSELSSEDSIAVAAQVARKFVEGKCFPQLLSRPLCGW